MEDVDINSFLQTLEDNYNQFEKLFSFDTEEFLSLGDKFISESILPDLDIPFNALEYVNLRKR